MPPSHSPAQLVRVIGRWSLTALVINSIIGSGIFGLPSVVAGLVGEASIVAYLVAAAGMGIIMACFAEVASQFHEAGGPYLYARQTFGLFVGLQMGWMTLLVRITAAGANANLFVDYLSEFFPEATAPLPRLGLLTLILGGLAAINYRGVQQGAQTSNIFAIAKLVPLAVFIVAGIYFIAGAHSPSQPIEVKPDWPKTMLLLTFAYGGFEAAMIPFGEVKNPRRDAPFALFSALVIVTLLYIHIQIIVMSVLPSLLETKKPLAEAARVFLGVGGAALMSVGAMISVYGYLSSALLNVPRLTFALGEKGDFPRFFGFIHKKFRTPHVSVLFFSGLVWALAIAGSFQWNATLSAVARLLTYAVVCGTMIKLRATKPETDAFRLPGGLLLAIAGILFSLSLFIGIGYGELVALIATIVVATANWVVRRTRPFLDQKS